MSNISTPNRIQGAIMGAFIGDALALGPHWYYNLDELHKNYGTWISDYTEPKPNHYHAGLKAGDSSQSGIILALTLSSLIAQHGYNEADFCQKMDDFYTQLNGTAKSGPGGYTSQSIRETWAARHSGKAWGDVAGHADNTDSAERNIALAAYYYATPDELIKNISQNTALFQQDADIIAMTTAYCVILGQLIAGKTLNEALIQQQMTATKDNTLPLLEPFSIAIKSIRSAQSNNPTPNPASQIAQVYGLPCAVYNVIPAAYHLAARFQHDFKSAVLHALNGGGQNMARAMLTGALAGAIGGIDAIPEYLIKGLNQSTYYLELSQQLAKQVVAKPNSFL